MPLSVHLFSLHTTDGDTVVNNDSTMSRRLMIHYILKNPHTIVSDVDIFAHLFSLLWSLSAKDFNMIVFLQAE